MNSDDETRELRRRKSAELEQWTRDTRIQLDQLKAAREEQQGRFRFFSRNRADLWKMPKWLWIPIVTILVGLFLLALLNVAVRQT